MKVDFKQSQFELFPKANAGADETKKPRFYFAKFTFSTENIVVLTIGVVLAMIISFSLGVEKGKKITLAALKNGKNVEAVELVRLDEPDEPLDEAEADETESAADETVIAVSEPETPERNAGGPEATVPDDGYTVQVASFKTREYAQKEASALRDTGYDSFVVGKGSYSIVCVGKFNQRDHAQSLSKELKKKYKDLLIRRL